MHDHGQTECDQQPSRVGIGASARCFCLPFLALRALSQALQSHDHVAVVFAHGEGDTDAARLCAHMPCRGVIAQDSDFFFYALSPVTPSSSAANEAVYIPFDSLRFVASESHAGGVDIVATSFARSRVCAALGLRDDKSGAALLRSIGTGSARGNGNNNGNGSGSGAEAVALPELPALACLVGNDVTLHLPWLAAFHDRLHALPALAVRDHVLKVDTRTLLVCRFSSPTLAVFSLRLLFCIPVVLSRPPALDRRRTSSSRRHQGSRPAARALAIAKTRRFGVRIDSLSFSIVLLWYFLFSIC